MTIETPDDGEVAVHVTDLAGPERDAGWGQFTAMSDGFASYEKKTSRVIPVLRLTPRSSSARLASVYHAYVKIRRLAQVATRERPVTHAYVVNSTEPISGRGSPGGRRGRAAGRWASGPWACPPGADGVQGAEALLEVGDLVGLQHLGQLADPVGELVQRDLVVGLSPITMRGHRDPVRDPLVLAGLAAQQLT